jgi:formimidoylglutamate deiminase
MRRLLAAHERDEGPIHIHVAEQQREVDECVAVTGRRPIEWLCGEIGLDARWQLVHATHATPDEIDAVARCGAGIVFCPGTEANLGDGLPDLTRWLAGGVPWSLGSDSHVTRSWTEELRWLEYGQRMTLKRRNVSAAPERGLPATATRLFENALHGGARAAGLKRWGLQVGARADLLVLDTGDPAMLGVHPERRLDAFVFSSPSEAIRDVYVAGRCVLRQRRHTQQAPIAAGFEQAMRELQRRA